MPELHQLTPALTSLQSKGFKVALVTDGRMSGASGAVPAAIHLTPECLGGGPLSRVQDGDIITLDSYTGILEARVAADTFAKRVAATPDLSDNQHGVGRELFATFRAAAGDAEMGAMGSMGREADSG
jgi:phosphogluconate dehydratase